MAKTGSATQSYPHLSLLTHGKGVSGTYSNPGPHGGVAGGEGRNKWDKLYSLISMKPKVRE